MFLREIIDWCESVLKKILYFSQPLQLFFAAITYTLGAGIARYLGANLRWPVFWLMLLAVLALQVSAMLFAAYFRQPLMLLAPDETPRQREQSQVRLLQSAYAALTMFLVVTVTLIYLRALDLSTSLLLGLSVVLLMAYTVPPFSLSRRGYGELVLAVYLATLLPALSFLLQADKFHRLLPLATFPLTLLAIACYLAANFPTFVADQKLGCHTLLTRLTWQWAVPIHHVLVLAAFLLFATAPFFGVAWGLVWPVFLALPFGLLQIAWLQRIANGGTPIWKFVNILVPSLLGLTIYLLTLSFWLH